MNPDMPSWSCSCGCQKCRTLWDKAMGIPLEKRRSDFSLIIYWSNWDANMLKQEFILDAHLLFNKKKMIMSSAYLGRPTMSLLGHCLGKWMGDGSLIFSCMVQMPRFEISKIRSFTCWCYTEERNLFWYFISFELYIIIFKLYITIFFIHQINFFFHHHLGIFYYFQVAHYNKMFNFIFTYVVPLNALVPTLEKGWLVLKHAVGHWHSPNQIWVYFEWK